LEIELSLPSVRRTILLLSSSEYVSYNVFSDMRISKTASNTSAQHALCQWSSILGHEPVPGREITKCILVVTPLVFCACDWSILPMETRLQEYSRAAVKCHSLTDPRLQKVVDKCFSVYVSNTCCRCKRLSGTPTAFSAVCSL